MKLFQSLQLIRNNDFNTKQPDSTVISNFCLKNGQSCTTIFVAIYLCIHASGLWTGMDHVMSPNINALDIAESPIPAVAMLSSGSLVKPSALTYLVVGQNSIS